MPESISNKHGVTQDAMLAISYMLIAVFMLSTMDVAIKQLVQSYPSIQVVLMRCALSAPIFALWMVFHNRQLFRPRNLRFHVVRAAVGLLMLFAVGECLRELPLADAYSIFFTAPLLLTILSGVVMNEPAGPYRIGAACLGFLGVLVVLRPGGASLFSYGSLMAFVAVFAYTGVAFLLRRLGRDEHSITITFWFTFLVGIGAAALCWPYWRALDSSHWPWLLMLGVSGTVGQITLTAAFRRASAAVIAPLDYLHMFWAVLYGWWFCGELPGLRTWLGTSIIVGSGLFILFREHRRRPQHNAAAVQPSGPASSR